MKKTIRATWVSRKEKSIWCCDFSGFESDHAGLLAEIAAAEAVIYDQPANSLLVAVDLYQTRMEPEVAAFFQKCARPAPNPIRKMAILYVSSLKQIWLKAVKGATWPAQAKFFSDYERAKDWLVGEEF